MKPTDFVLLVRYPAAGRVKRRLAAGTGDCHAAALYRAFVADILSTFARARIVPTICYHPAEAKTDISRWLGYRYPYLAQRGSDHPGRLRRALEELFARGSSRVVIVASDNPDLPAELLRGAREALEKNEAVLGPTLDGGYYLIGFRKEAFVPEAFSGIDWSTSRVFGQTVAKIQDAGRSVATLPRWSDVDTLEDLQALASRGSASAVRGSRTMEYLRQYPEVLHQDGRATRGRKGA
jgi:rSAM/selenodomain-associated transferase 1